MAPGPGITFTFSLPPLLETFFGLGQAPPSVEKGTLSLTTASTSPSLGIALPPKAQEPTPWVITLEKIEKWAPSILIGSAFLLAFFRFSLPVLTGVALAVYEKLHPGELPNKIQAFAQQYFPYKNHPYGLGSIMVNTPASLNALVVLMGLGHPEFARHGLATYFAYKATTAFLNPKGHSPDPTIVEKN